MKQLKNKILNDALNNNAITQKEYDSAQCIEFDMCEEDIPVFFHNIRKFNVAADTIKHVTYGDIDNYDDSFRITLLDDTVITVSQNF